MKRVVSGGIIGIICLMSWLVPVQAEPINTTRMAPVAVTLNESAVKFDSPFLIYQNTVYAPLRGIVKGLNGKTTYLRRDDAFQLTIPTPNATLVLVPNSTEVWVNNAQSYFASRTFFKDGEFYVPFESFFKLLGFTPIRTGNNYVVKRVVSPKPIQISVPQIPTSQFVMATRPPKPRLDSGIPSIPSGSALSIGFGAKVYSLNGKFFMANGTVYADLESALQKEGISMIKRPDSVELIVGAKTYRFDTASPDVRIGFGGKVETRGVGYPLIVKNGVPYLAIRGLAAALNYGLMWDSASRRIQLLNSIQRVAVLNQGGLYKAVIHASHPVSSLPAVPLNRENGFSVDLLNAQLAFDDETMESDNSPVYQMTVSQVSDTRVRISLVLKSSVGYSSVIPNSMGGEMLLSSRITTIDSRIDGQAVVFRIEGIGSFTPKVWALPSPSIVVLDVPESYSLVPMVIRPVQGQSTVQLVRTSQFKLDPPATRIVFDTVSTRNYAVTRISSSTYEIRFPIAAGVTLPVVVTPTRSVSGHTAHVTSNRLASGNVIASASGTISLSPTSHIIARPVTLTSAVRTQKISKPTPQRPLYRKVIVIDPGHGGSDPGSIGVNNTYEKEITIDISRRLKSALEAEGAVVIMCRNNDENPSLQERCDVGNVNNADLFISVHINSFFHPYASGTETYYYKPEDKLFSAYVHEEMVKTLGFRDNGLKRARLYVLRNTKMPALLVEPGFITNPQEFAHMNTPSGRQKIAEAIVQGTVRYVSAR